METERRRSSLGAVSTPHRASDACLDPHHAAILFRDSRGVSTTSVSYTHLDVYKRQVIGFFNHFVAEVRRFQEETMKIPSHTVKALSLIHI